jgi:hypothetical protein
MIDSNKDHEIFFLEVAENQFNCGIFEQFGEFS